ncbi:hypothetical protein [Phaeovulum sp. NW3]|uniref:hypothetical protein n=1 Tax=Phaeovulum sp. NW3 TaxID=2934933 RepID=UPI0020226EAB|nr:hypothetical protein [Phaeovulum sp. NW3]MCL7466814.1 hypothetical protein [Phaeovulum sp. NW3]
MADLSSKFLILASDGFGSAPGGTTRGLANSAEHACSIAAHAPRKAPMPLQSEVVLVPGASVSGNSTLLRLSGWPARPTNGKVEGGLTPPPQTPLRLE